MDTLLLLFNISGLYCRQYRSSQNKCGPIGKGLANIVLKMDQMQHVLQTRQGTTLWNSSLRFKVSEYELDKNGRLEHHI